MFKKQLNITYEEYNSANELPPQLRKLVLQARQISEQAYAPYSRFRVGASVLLSDSTIVLGNNQENASYPEGLCAERVAVFAAMANHAETNIKAIAICSNPLDFETRVPLSPCGACRQVLAEYENKSNQPISILLCSLKGHIILIHSVKDLLPFQFSAENLSE